MKTLAFLKRGGVYLPINLRPIKNQNKMKKLIYFAVCCIAAFSFSSCSKDYVGSERNLRGKWEFYREEKHYVEDVTRTEWEGGEIKVVIEHKAGDVVVDDRTSYKEYWTFKKDGVLTVEEIADNGETDTEIWNYVFDRDSKQLKIVLITWHVSHLTNSELVLDDQDDKWGGSYWSVYYFRKVK